MELKQAIEQALTTYISSSNWEERRFDLKKAYVCALFSAQAYELIRGSEAIRAKITDRVYIVPSDTYRRVITERSIIDFYDPTDYDSEDEDIAHFNESMSSLEFGPSEYFHIATKYAVIIVVRTVNVVFIAIRGTDYLYDWYFNTNIWPRKVYLNGSKAYFHNGFFKATRECLKPTIDDLRDFIRSRSKQIPIYITGHSLGGAISSIMYAIFRFKAPKELNIHSCYTFGMPRYGDKQAVSFRTPYHIRNEKDIVPVVPPKWLGLGYENCPSEFRLDGTVISSYTNYWISLLLHTIYENIDYAGWVSLLLYKKSIEEHKIDVYREKIRKALEEKHLL